jgi:putative transposase
MMLDEGAVTVFVAVEHCRLEGIGIHAASRATWFEALEPLRQGFGGSSGPSESGSRQAYRCAMIMAANR